MSSRLPQLGVYVEDFQAGVRRGLESAAGLGFAAVQLESARGETSPQELSASGRRHLSRHIRGLGLSLAALRADLGGGRFLDSALAEQHVERMRSVMQLARDLQVEVVSAPVGRFAADSPPQYALVREALAHVAEHADLLGVAFAIETAVESPHSLQKLLQDLNCSQVKVCYDPAELLMDGFDPLQPIEPLADDIALSVVRDGELGSRSRPGRETNLGAGHLNLSAYLKRLGEAGYRGHLLLRRSHSNDPVSELRLCKSRLESALESGVPR